MRLCCIFNSPWKTSRIHSVLEFCKTLLHSLKTVEKRIQFFVRLFHTIQDTSKSCFWLQRILAFFQTFWDSSKFSWDNSKLVEDCSRLNRDFLRLYLKLLISFQCRSRLFKTFKILQVLLSRSRNLSWWFGNLLINIAAYKLHRNLIPATVDFKLCKLDPAYSAFERVSVAMVHIY